MRVVAFAAAREQAGFAELEIAAAPSDTPREIVSRLAPALPVDTLRAAVDCEYWGWDQPIGAAAELAIIPPVSGG